jgi:voltage-gated potassium channel
LSGSRSTLGIGLGILLLGVWVVIGTFGFRLIEGWTLIESLYMTIITISTVGFQEVHDLSNPGRLFASFIIVAGLGTAVYTFTRVGQVLLEGELLAVLGRRRLKHELDRLDGHLIVCGCGRIGQPVIGHLLEESVPFCVIDRDVSLEDQFREQGVRYLIGDATEEESLQRAGIARARSLLALLPSDAENLYLTITAKSMNPKVVVISRSSDERAGLKLKLGGADRVVSPYGVASIRVLHLAMRPTVIDLLELVTQPSSLGLMLDEFLVGRESPLRGRTLGESDVRSHYGVTVVAIKRDAETAILHPGPEVPVNSGDIVVAMGRGADLRKLQDACERGV